MADIYGRNISSKDQPQVREFTAGESYQAILKEENQKSKNELHSEWMFDHSKISLIYAHAHRAAILNPEAEIVINFYDDTDSILAQVEEFFNHNKNLLIGKDPKKKIGGIKLNLFKYEKGNLERYKNSNSIEGTGPVDTHYDWTVRYLAATTRHGPALDLKNAQELQIYHQIYDYNKDVRGMEMYGNRVDVDKLISFRDQEISKLTSNTQITQTANYTTATALRDQGLIPKKWVINPKQQHTEAPAPNISKQVPAQRQTAVAEQSAIVVAEQAAVAGQGEFEISDDVFKQIEEEIKDYIANRCRVAKNTEGKYLEPTLFSKIFRNPKLTQAKSELAHELLARINGFDRTNVDKPLSPVKSYNKLAQLLATFSENNKLLENNHNKTYGCFTNSGLGRSLNKISNILEEAKRAKNGVKMRQQ